MAKHTVKRKYIAASNEEDREAEHICAIIEKKLRSSEGDASADSFDAKSMLLFGNSLFPDNFRMKFQSYKIAKLAGNVEQAAQLFRTMYLSFPNEQSFYAELCAVIEDVRTEQRTTNTDLFHHLSKNMQCEILLKFCQTASSTLDEANLQLFIMRSYPHTVREHAFDVIDALAALERESFPQQALNIYRQRLVCDLLPLLFSQMGKKKELEAKLGVGLLHKALTFHLTYGLLRSSGESSKNNLVRGTTEEHPRLENPWLSVRQLLDSMSGYFSWGSLPLPRLPRNSAGSQSQQPVEEFVRGLDSALQTSRSPHRLVLPLVVAHVETVAAYLRLTKPTLFLCSLESVKDEIRAGDNEDAARAFTLAMTVWRHAIRLPKEGRKEFDETLRLLRLEPWQRLQIFYAETTTLHSNPFSQCQLNERLPRLLSAPGHLFLDAQMAWEKRRAHAVRQLVLCLQALYSAETQDLSEPASIFPEPSEPPDDGLPFLTPLTFAWLFNRVVHLLVRALTPVCRRVTAWNHAAFGHSLVLLQWMLGQGRKVDWLRAMLGMIRQYGSLCYPNFFRYVISTDLLEEVVTMQRLPSRPVLMMLAPDIKEENAETEEGSLTKHAQLQVEKCHLPVGPLIYEFLVGEVEAIAACFG